MCLWRVDAWGAPNGAPAFVFFHTTAFFFFTRPHCFFFAQSRYFCGFFYASAERGRARARHGSAAAFIIILNFTSFRAVDYQYFANSFL